MTLLVNGPLASLNPATDPTPAESALAATSKSVEFAPSSAMDVLRAHFEYLAFLFQKLPPLRGLGASGFAYRDHLQVPLQPLADNLDNSVYQTFERDRPKYEFYQEAVRQALHDLQFKQDNAVPPEAGPILIAVLGAGRGPLVEASLNAADSVGATVMVMAIEKNPNAVAVLSGRLQDPHWHGRVALVAVDMREMIIERQADIMACTPPLPVWCCHSLCVPSGSDRAHAACAGSDDTLHASHHLPRRSSTPLPLAPRLPHASAQLAMRTSASGASPTRWLSPRPQRRPTTVCMRRWSHVRGGR